MNSDFQLDILSRTRVRIPRAYLKKWLALVGRELRLRRVRFEHGQVVRLIFVSAPEMKKLNRTFRSKAYATDVLSFPSPDAEDLGELVLCPQVIARQAREHGLSFREELAYMVLHGVLHLLGFEHEGVRDRGRAMFQIQDDIFQKIDKLK